MKAIKIYTQDSKYFMEDLDTNTTVELTATIHQAKDNTDWFKLPENSTNRKLVCKQMIDRKIEIVYEEKTPRSSNPVNTTKSTRINLTEYYTDDEKAQIEKLQAEIDKINEAAMERAKKDQTMKALEEQLKALDPEVLKAMMTKMMGGEA